MDSLLSAVTLTGEVTGIFSEKINKNYNLITYYKKAFQLEFTRKLWLQDMSTPDFSNVNSSTMNISTMKWYFQP